jgi:hypothetical protein
MPDMKTWLIRLPFVVVTAAAMSFIGLAVLSWAAVTFAGMERGNSFFPRTIDGMTLWVVLASIVLWMILTAFLRDQAWPAWCIGGLASPVAGCLLVAPPWSFSMFLNGYGVFAFPIGLLTGLLMWAIFRVKFPVPGCESAGQPTS